MARGFCRLTGKEGDLRRAHLTPKAFYNLEPNIPLTSISSDLEERPIRSQAGLWDGELVIKETEELFGLWDDYAARLLRPKVGLNEYVREGGKIALSNDGTPVGFKRIVDSPDKLRKFFWSLLWRYGASTRQETRAVDLGPHLERLAELLKGDREPKPGEYAVAIGRFLDSENAITTTPTFVRLDGIGTWHMLLGDYEVHIKADKRPFPGTLGRMAYSGGGDFLAYTKRLRGSPLWKKMSSLVKAKDERFGDPWKGRFDRG